MNYYNHHIGDYDSHTSHLTMIEDCAYRRLICLYYRSEQPLPKEINKTCRLIRANNKLEREAVEQVLSEFFSLQDDGWHSLRCDNEINAYSEKAAKNKANGAKGGRPKKEPNNNPPETHWDNLGFENETQTKGNQEPRTKSHKPLTNNQEPIKSMAISPIEQAQESPPKTKRFIKPDFQETKIYFQELRSDQAQAFFDFYESKGWLVGKSKMKDWKAAARGWISRQSQFQKTNGNQKTAIAKNQDAWDEYYAQQEQDNMRDITPTFGAINHVQ